MGIAGDIFLSVPIGITYYFFINKLMILSTNNMPYAERFQRSLIFIFVVGLISLILAFTLFKNNDFFKNRPIRFGLILGSSLLIFYSIISNWGKMDDTTKIIIFSILLFVLIWYSYYSGDDYKVKKKKKTKQKKDNI